jgi:hypothetical protein
MRACRILYDIAAQRQSEQVAVVDVGPDRRQRRTAVPHSGPAAGSGLLR